MARQRAAATNAAGFAVMQNAARRHQCRSLLAVIFGCNGQAALSE